ncbi:hypothetical protein [Maledivibacter halophilus]|uniref:Uncharacterized protein n=1 Tax=Maledivibacter halophilus TaxID=36842 RepID=A0A1T5K195_9FIRM|nr:hypothetical protein [Maledivibacter halophilus]SKC57374.1 hypothetical protein SAMN02194393_01536 [Maledivibacter halophilus]
MEPVEVTLAEALVHGQTEVTFSYEEVEYTATLVEAYVDEAIVAVNEAANYLTMQAALEAPELGLELGAYADFTDTNKETVATNVLAARPEAGFADLAAIQEAFDAEASAIVSDAFDTAFAAINAVTVNTGGEMETAINANFADLDLQGLGAEYDELAAAQQTSVAAAVFAIKDALPAPGADNDRHEDAVAKEFYDKAELEAAFEDDTAMPAAALAQLNAAGDAAAVLVAFELESLGLVFPAEYEAMSDDDKTAVATAVHGAVGALTLAQAQVALDDAVLAQIQANEDNAASKAALLAVNEATNAVEMRLGLESTDFATATPKADIDAKNYTSEQKTWLAEEVIELRDALEDYADDNNRNAEAVAGVIYDETELDTIVTTAIGTIDARIAAITTAEASLAAIPTPVEDYQLNAARDGIDVDDAATPLAAEVTDARTDVDAAVTAGAVEADLEGIEVLTAAEAKVQELESEIAVIAAVDAVNAADGDTTAIRVALTAEELGLDAYNALSLTDKNTVAAAIDLAIDDLQAYADDNTRNENALANEFYDLAELEAAVVEAIANLE